MQAALWTPTSKPRDVGKSKHVGFWRRGTGNKGKRRIKVISSNTLQVCVAGSHTLDDDNTEAGRTGHSPLGDATEASAALPAKSGKLKAQQRGRQRIGI